MTASDSRAPASRLTVPAARPFTGAALDRASTERKDPAVVERLLADSAAQAVLAGRDGVLIADGERRELVRVRAEGTTAGDSILLGLEQGRPLFAIDIDSLGSAAQAALTDGARMVSLREAGAELAHEEGGLAAYVVALLNWHRKHRFCANCGAATGIQEAGFTRHCPRCGTTHFPRTDPVVIMTVEHEGPPRRLLLGRRAGWPTQRFSVLAGFVAPGESAEEAVVREVREESGIVARDPAYVSSQPWPFPSSLMLGFAARSDGGEPSPGDGELGEVRWFTDQEVRDAIDGRHPDVVLPPPISIARFLIERWTARSPER